MRPAFAQRPSSKNENSITCSADEIKIFSGPPTPLIPSPTKILWKQPVLVIVFGSFPRFREDKFVA
jgi:hypothetical protein